MLAFRNTLKRIMAGAAWSFDGKIHSCTVTFLRNGTKAEVTRRGSVYLSVYNTIWDQLTDLSKSGIKISEFFVPNTTNHEPTNKMPSQITGISNIAVQECDQADQDFASR